MHSVSQLLFGALTARLTGALPALHPPSVEAPPDGAAGLFSLALGAEQQSLSGEMPHLPGLTLPPATMDAAAETSVSEAAALETLPLPQAPDDASSHLTGDTSRVSGGSGTTADPATGNGLPPTLLEAGKALPHPAAAGPAVAPGAGQLPTENTRMSAARTGEASTAGVPSTSAVAEAEGLAPGAAADQGRQAARAAAHGDINGFPRAEPGGDSAVPPMPPLREARAPAATQPATGTHTPDTAAPEAGSRAALESLRHAMRPVAGVDGALAPVSPHDRQSAENALRAMISGNGGARPQDMPQAGADLPRPAGSEFFSARQPTAEAALIAAGATDARAAAQERVAAPNPRHGRSDQSRTGEAAADRGAAPGAEGFEQQLRAAALRTVAPVTVARDIGMLAERIEMLMHRRGDFANLNLSLGDLGDLRISVRMEANQAHISFVAQDAAVRETLEQQLPRLRVLLEQSGVDVGDMGMDLSQGPGDQDARGDRSASTTTGRAGIDATEPEQDVLTVRRTGDGSHIIDAFA